MAFKSVLDNFKKVKESLVEEKEKKKGGGEGYSHPLIFNPKMVKGEERTRFRLRFLPVTESRIGKPFVIYRYHQFQRDGDAKFIKVIDPRMFSKDAQNPISIHATKLWNSDNALDKEMAKKYFSSDRWMSLVYVKEAPENQKDYEGKVLIFEYGKQVFDVLDLAINEYDNCFWDPFKGQDFLLMLKEKPGQKKWPDYTQSAFIGEKGPVVDDEKEMDRISIELEKISIKNTILEKDPVKSAEELEELLWGGLKNVEKNKSEGVNLTESSETEAPSAKPKINAAKNVDFGDTNISASTPKATEKVATKETVKESSKASEKVASKEEAKSEGGEFDIDLSDIDLKF